MVLSMEPDGSASRHSMSATDAVGLLEALRHHGVDPCVGGGWAVDALLGEQTRPHADLDLWLPAAHLEMLIVAFAECGLDRVFPWGGDRPWNFVLHDGGRMRVDLHLYEPVPDGQIHYGGVLTGELFPAAALQGRGMINGTPVRCEAAHWSVRWHSGYPPREVDRHDVLLLCERFGIDLPPAFRAP